MRVRFQLCFLLLLVFFSTANMASQALSQGKIDGTIQAANRSFQDVVTGPRARIFSGMSLTVKVASGQADVNFVHRENRKCKWYGKCWYERWIDHNFHKPSQKMWPIEYRWVDEEGKPLEGGLVDDGLKTEFTVVAPGGASQFNRSFRLQARFSDTPTPIDANRTNGAFLYEVRFDPSKRISRFPEFLNNGGFLPLSAEISQMLQLDIWTREQGSVELSRALVNYARVYFPSDDDLSSTEHFRLLEIAQGLDPESDSVSRALVDYYVTENDFSSASDEIRKNLKPREEALQANPNDRVSRIALAKDYAFLASLTEREGTLLTPQEYKRVDSLFDRSVRHAVRGNSREALANILFARANVLRKSNTEDGLENARVAQQEVVELLGQSLNGHLVSISPDKRFALVSKAPASRGMINQPIENVGTDFQLQTMNLGSPDMSTRRGLKPLAVAASGEILVDDGGILSNMTLGDGKFEVLPKENVSFHSAETYNGGVFGISKDAGGFRFSFLPEDGALESIPFGASGVKEAIPAGDGTDEAIRALVADLPNRFHFSASQDDTLVVALERKRAPEKRLFRLSGTQVLPLDLDWDLSNAEVELIELSPNGKHLAAFVHRYTGEAEPLTKTSYLEVISLDGSAALQLRQEDVADKLNIAEITGLAFSNDGLIVGVLADVKITRVNIESSVVSEALPITGSAVIFDEGPHLFGIDNEGALFAAAAVKDGGRGRFFRLAYNVADEDFADDPERAGVANRILRETGVIFLAKEGKVNIGIPRYTMGDFSIVDLATGEVSELSGRAVHYASTQLLSGGSFLVSVDDLANSVILHDFRTGSDISSIDPSEDLGDDLPNEGIFLKPHVFPLETPNDWTLVWVDRRDLGVFAVSRYSGEKQVSSLVLDRDRLSRLSAELTKTLQAPEIQATGLTGTDPGVKFVLASGELRQIDGSLRITPIVSVTHRLGGIDPLNALTELPTDLSGPLMFPIVDLTRDKLDYDFVESERYGRIIAFDRDSGAIAFNYRGNVYHRHSGKPATRVDPTQPAQNEDVAPVFVPNLGSRGNLAGAVVAYLLKHKDTGRVRVDYRIFDGEGTQALPCGFCQDHGSENDIAKRFGIGELIGLIDFGERTYSLPSGDHLLLFSQQKGAYPLDELPLSWPIQLSHGSRHIVQEESGVPQLFVPKSQ